MAEWTGAIFITDAEAEGQTQQEMNLTYTYTDRHLSPRQRRRDIMAARDFMYIHFLYIKSNLANCTREQGQFICISCDINICYILLLKADPGAKMVLATFALISCRGWPLCNWPHWSLQDVWRLQTSLLKSTWQRWCLQSAAARKISFDVFLPPFVPLFISALLFLSKLWLVPPFLLSLSSPLPKQSALSERPRTINIRFSKTANFNFTLEFDTMD